MQSVSTFFKEENDVFYRRGAEKGEVVGEEKKSFAVVANLISELALSDEKIARIAEVSIDFVKKVRTSTSK